MAGLCHPIGAAGNGGVRLVLALVAGYVGLGFGEQTENFTAYLDGSFTYMFVNEIYNSSSFLFRFSVKFCGGFPIVRPKSHSGL